VTERVDRHITEMRILLLAARCGPHVLFGVPNRTQCTPFVSVIQSAPGAQNLHAEVPAVTCLLCKYLTDPIIGCQMGPSVFLFVSLLPV
jgi:hypothetical protein